MNRIPVPLLFLFSFFLVSCSVNKNYSPSKKIPRKALQEDYTILKNILENKHPSLYWYTSKDSMDRYFSKYYNAITDSMNEVQFAWQVLAPLVDKIHCGHTSVGMSKSYSKWSENKRFPSFPLYMKIWDDTMAVTGNLNRKDSVIKRGTLITSINGIPNKKLIENIFSYLHHETCFRVVHTTEAGRSIETFAVRCVILERFTKAFFGVASRLRRRNFI